MGPRLRGTTPSMVEQRGAQSKNKAPLTLPASGAWATAIGGRLIGDAGVMRAIGQSAERLAAAEKRNPRWRDRRPAMTGGLRSIPTATVRWLIGTTLSWAIGSASISTIEGMSDARCCPRETDATRASCAARDVACAARAADEGLLARPESAQPVDFADHGVTRHISEFRGDLAGRKPGLPELF